MADNNNYDNIEQNNIVKFHPGFQINVGFFIVAIIFLYIGFHIFTSLTKTNVTIYEVEEGTIVTNNSYQALAIRDETIVNADHAGHVYYYGTNKSRVGVRSTVYAIDSTGELTSKMKADNLTDIVLSSKDLKSVSKDVDSFIHDYSDTGFQNVYSFKSNLEEMLTEMHSQQVIDEYADEIERAINASTFASYKAIMPGLLCYVVDGYEDVSIESFDSGSFDRGGITYTNLRMQDEVVEGQAVYKLVTSEDWNLVTPIEKSVATRLAETENIRINFLADNAKTWARSQIIERAGTYYLILSLDDSMERYADQRYVSIELLLESERGLKIPNSAITNKDFFVIPKEYFLQGSDSKALGLLVKGEEGNEDRFINPTVYYETEDSYYIDSEYISSEEEVIMEGSNRKYKAGKNIAQLPGVYSVNKGYTIFKQIDIAYQNENYTVVRSGTNYGIALYDHIVLQADSVSENEILN